MHTDPYADTPGTTDQARTPEQPTAEVTPAGQPAADATPAEQPSADATPTEQPTIDATPVADRPPTGSAAEGRREVVVAEAEPVRLPDWMRSMGQEHQPTGLDRVRFFLARHNGPLTVGLAFALALVMVVAAGWMVVRVADWRRTATVAPSASATPEPISAVGTPRDHFAGTPAASFPVGKESIVLPPATAAGPFSAAQVRAALDLVGRALVESRLELRMMVGDTGKFLALLAPDARAQVQPWLNEGRLLTFATRTGSQVQPVDDARARGRISYRATEANGIRLLEVTTEFVWAYPFDVVRRAPAGAGVAVIRDRVVWHVPYAADVVASSRGLWLDSAKMITWNVDCAKHADGWLDVIRWMPEQHGERPPGGDPGAIFDLDAPRPVTRRC
ncbi:hypothetical protein ACGFIR_11125 [Micromonospora sp. NPDC049051]|uniref:hypothetical protein n=1 Tax=Micromonospora sp. NPDC049051 TaxID=3364264 RepID=UPI003721BFB6